MEKKQREEDKEKKDEEKQETDVWERKKIMNKKMKLFR